MDNPLNLTSCDFNQYEQWQTVTALWAPVYSLPIYLCALFLVKQYSDTQNNYIRVAQVLAIVFNYMELIVMSTMFFPQFRIPVLGLQVGGVMENLYPRVITFVIVALEIHQGINLTTTFIAHFRLRLLSQSLALRKSSLNFIVSKSNQLAFATYILLVISAFSILPLFNLDNLEYQKQWKNEFYQIYHLDFIWCPIYQVLDPTAWEFALMMIVACTVTVIFAVVFVLCSIATIIIAQSARETMSAQTVRYHIRVVISFLISCAIQAFFVVLPVVHMLLCVYFEFFKVYTGGLLYYSILTQAHQGTAFTVFYVVFHPKTRKALRKLIPSSRAAEKLKNEMMFTRTSFHQSN